MSAFSKSTVPREGAVPGPILGKILEHLDLWDTRNYYPPDEEDSHIAELVYDDSVSQIPQYDYWD